MENELFRVIIRELNPHNLSLELKEKIGYSVLWFENAFKSAYFHESLMNSITAIDPYYAQGLTREQIYQKLINADETDENTSANVADLYLNVWQQEPPEEEVGEVIPGSKIINTFKRRIVEMSHADLAGHYAHEWTHVIGFKHPVYTGLNAKFLMATVPYMVGSIVKDYVQLRMSDLNLS